jgi:hypothetical protein
MGGLLGSCLPWRSPKLLACYVTLQERTKLEVGDWDMSFSLFWHCWKNAFTCGSCNSKRSVSDETNCYITCDGRWELLEGGGLGAQELYHGITMAVLPFSVDIQAYWTTKPLPLLLQSHSFVVFLGHMAIARELLPLAGLLFFFENFLCLSLYSCFFHRLLPISLTYSLTHRRACIFNMCKNISGLKIPWISPILGSIQ